MSGVFMYGVSSGPVISAWSERSAFYVKDFCAPLTFMTSMRSSSTL